MKDGDRPGFPGLDRLVQLLGPLVGVAVVLVGLALIVLRGDGASGYSFLGIGAAILGTARPGPLRRCRSTGAR